MLSREELAQLVDDAMAYVCWDLNVHLNMRT